MRVLDRKVLRDAWNLRGQVLTVAAVIATGVAVVVGSVSTYVSLLDARDGYYRVSRFADVWVDVERAPRTLVPLLREIPGVAVVEARVVKDVRVDWPRSNLAVAGRIVSIPAASQPDLNRLHILRGRWPDPLRRDEVLISAGFADYWAVAPGETVRVILNGRLQAFEVAGVVQSPEFIYAARQGIPLPDDRSFVIMWAIEEAVAAAFDMQGAFNNVAVTLAPGASPPDVIAALDARLDRQGGRGAYERQDQASHRFLDDELAEQLTLAITIPMIFFGVAAFLLNVILGRLVDAQREQVAALKALGFPSWPIAAHYLKFGVLICALGSVAGLAGGIWYGQAMLRAYTPFFRFPELVYSLPLWVPFLAIMAGLLAASTGVVVAARRILKLKPAEAMRAAVPAGAGNILSGARLPPWAKMVLRGIAGRPVRAILTVLGLSFSVPVTVLGLFWWDALDAMVAVQFDAIERGDAVVTFTDPVAGRAVRELAAIPGVLAVEGQRIVPARLRAGHRTYRIAITGIAGDAELRVPRDASLRPVRVPADGIVLSTGLAERLGVGVGGVIVADVLEGERPTRTLQVSALTTEVLGFSAYMDLDALRRVLRDGDRVSHAVLRMDPASAATAWRLISDRPRVAGTSSKRVLLQIFDDTVAGIVLVSATVLTLFGMIVAIGVVYNAARIALQEHAWELASLRILGFTLQEVSRILFVGLVVELLVAIPLGLVLAQVTVTALLSLRENESFTIPPLISFATFTTAALVVLASGLGSGLLVRRMVDRLDLVAVLKARD